MTKKRLSPKATKLVEGAKRMYAHSPAKAIQYLKSIPAEKLNPYDRAKIGREIRARGGDAREYDIPSESAYEQPQYGKYLPENVNRIREHAKELFNRGEGYEGASNKDMRLLSMDKYKKSGELYEKIGDTINATTSYGRALNIAKKEGESGEAELLKEGLNRLGKKLKKLLSRESGQSRLEQTAKTASVIGVLGGFILASGKITGGTIGVGDPAIGNLRAIGIGLIILGMIGMFFFFRKKN